MPHDPAHVTRSRRTSSSRDQPPVGSLAVRSDDLGKFTTAGWIHFVNFWGSDVHTEFAITNEAFLGCEKTIANAMLERFPTRTKNLQSTNFQVGFLE
jgi:hypothetical protein